jgi:hypothetical protein
MKHIDIDLPCYTRMLATRIRTVKNSRNFHDSVTAYSRVGLCFPKWITCHKRPVIMVKICLHNTAHHISFIPHRLLYTVPMLSPSTSGLPTFEEG